MPVIQTPRGAVNFPDEMSHAQIEAVLQKEFPIAPAAPQPLSGSIGATSTTTPQPVNLATDVGKSGWGGLLGGITGTLDSLNPGTVAQRGQAAAMALMGDKRGAAIMNAYLQQHSLTQATAGLGSTYQPQTTPGRYAHAVGTMLPNAIAPETLPAKIGAVLIPALSSQGATDITKAAGGDATAQGVAGFAGGLAGGGLAGFRGGASRAPQILTDAEKPAAQAVRAALDMTGAHRDDVKAITAGGMLPAAATSGLQQLAETVATLPGPGKIALQDAAGARMGTQYDRALNAVTQHLGVDPAAAKGNVDSIVTAGQKAADPIYQQIRANPTPVWSADLARLAQRPAIKKAIGVVSNDMLNSGKSPTTAGFALDPDTGWSLPKTFENVENQPTADTWIGVHQALGRTVERNPLTGKPLPDSQSPGNFGIGVSGRDLRDQLTQVIPGYDQALATSGDYLSTAGAYNKAGGKLFSGPVSDFADMWGSLKSPSEIQAARASMANDVLERADRGSFLPGQFKVPGIRQKLAIAFPDGAPGFAQQMEDDLAERGAYNNILSNSRTAGRNALVDQFQANMTKPVGPIRKAAQGLTAGIDNVASFTHPLTAVTKVARMVAGTNTPKAPIASPWDDPNTNALLGNLLSDPKAMNAFLDKMSAQDTGDYMAQHPGPVGLLRGPGGVALPGLLSGLLAGPATAQANQGQPPQ